MPSEGLTPPLIETIPVLERGREVFIDLIDQWKAPYPKGIGEGMDMLLGEMVTGPGKDLETMLYPDFLLLFHVIEERYRQEDRKKKLAEEKVVE